MRLTSPLNLPAPGRRQWLYGDSSSSQPPVFLLNSRLDRFSATGLCSGPHGPFTYCRHPFSRSYGVILPSSFSTDHSSTLGFSPRLPVSVCGTVGLCIPVRGFSRRPAPQSLSSTEVSLSASGLTSSPLFRTDQATPLHRDNQNPTIASLPRPPNDQHTQPGTGILTRFPSSTALALDLGAG